MRVLVTTCPAVGHLLPLLPLAREAAAQGHDVRVAAGTAILPIAERAGFRTVTVGPDSLRDVARAIPTLAGLTGRRRAVVMAREGFAGSIARTVAADLLAALEGGSWRPDLIVREDMEIGSWIVAERLGIPHATVQVTAWRPPVRRLLAEAVEPLRIAYGLAPDATERMLGSVFFSTRPASLHDPAAPLPEVTAELRPIADDRDGAPAEDAADANDPADPFAAITGPSSAPRVIITLGTVNADQHALLRTLIAGAVAAGAKVVVGLGSDPADFGDVPGSVVLRRYVPMSTLLPRADMIAFHGGSGTLTAALAAARPMLITPIAADQLDNAERAVAAGVARSLAMDDLTPTAVAESIERLRSDASYRYRAAAVADEIAAMPGPDAAVLRLGSIVAAAGALAPEPLSRDDQEERT